MGCPRSWGADEEAAALTWSHLFVSQPWLRLWGPDGQAQRSKSRKKIGKTAVTAALEKGRQNKILGVRNHFNCTYSSLLWIYMVLNKYVYIHMITYVCMYIYTYDYIYIYISYLTCNTCNDCNPKLSDFIGPTLCAGRSGLRARWAATCGPLSLACWSCAPGGTRANGEGDVRNVVPMP